MFIFIDTTLSTRKFQVAPDAIAAEGVGAKTVASLERSAGAAIVAEDATLATPPSVAKPAPRPNKRKPPAQAEARKGESKETKQLRRIVTPGKDGQASVPREVVDAFNDTRNGGREKVLREWAACGYQKDSPCVRFIAHFFAHMCILYGIYTCVYMLLRSFKHEHIHIS